MDSHVCDVRLRVDTASLEKRGDAPMWGRVCFSIGGAFFPDAGWTDIVAGFCTYWVDALRRLASNETSSESVFFMDGPFRADLTRRTADTIELSLVDPRDGDKSEYCTEQTAAALLADAVACSQSLLDVATVHRWVDGDIRALHTAIEAAKPSLSD